MAVRTKAPQLVKDVMTADPICIGADTSARELARILESNGISGVPVVDSLHRIIGVASKTDLLRRCVEGPLGSRPGSFFESLAEGLGTGTDVDPEELGAVEDFMTTEPVTCRPDEGLGVVARRMAEENVHRIIVVDQRRHVVGIVTSLDLLREFPA
ncbi:MAG: CBS domain-containing protein [Planctomycetota bacterium]|jgi:CBS domain-containing protein